MVFKTIIHVLFFGLLMYIPADLFGQEEGVDVAQVNSYLSIKYPDSGPGAVIGIIRQGELIFAEAYGLADIEAGRPMEVSSFFDVMSVAKQFTAASVGLLVLRDLLSIDDYVRDYVPELPEYASEVTIRHLIHHTSGIRDIHSLWTLAGGSPEDSRGGTAHLQMLQNQVTLNFTPGEEYSYSNSGYMLLALIVERVSGIPFPEFVRREIFEPLEMDDTRFLDPEPDNTSAGVPSYRRDRSGQWIRLVNRDRRTGASDLVTTIPDMAKWVANFEHFEVGGEHLVQLTETQGLLSSGEVLEYAWGNIIDRHEGFREILHSGGLLGIRCKISRFPTHSLGLIFCANGTPNLNADFYPIASYLLLGKPLPEAVPASSNFNSAVVEGNEYGDDIETLLGNYASSELDCEWVIEQDSNLLLIKVGDELLGQAAFIDNDQGWGFSHPEVGSVNLHFLPNEQGAIKHLVVSTNRISELIFDRR